MISFRRVYWLFICQCAKVVVCCLSRDGIALHVEGVEPVAGKVEDYGFAQQIKAFVVEEPTRTPTAGDLGRSNR